MSLEIPIIPRRDVITSIKTKLVARSVVQKTYIGKKLKKLLFGVGSSSQ